MGMIELTKIQKILEEQRLRCHKPHFSSGHYEGRFEIESWNNGVDSLARELRELLGAFGQPNPSCPTCVKFKGQMMPPHNASSKCESGGYSHCSCDICF